MYEVVSDAPIANINKEVADHVEIHFDGQPVKNMFLLILRIVNTGNIAVKPDDYTEPLEVIFKERKVISSEILETSPQNLISEGNLKDFFRLGDNSLKLAPILLNPSESLNIKILLMGSQGYPELRARIADGHIITGAELRKRQDTLTIERSRWYTMNLPTTMQFWLGCWVIVVASILQVVFPWFLGRGPFVIILAVGFCVWQWHRKVRQLIDFIEQEKSMRQAADHYIRARFPT